MSSAARRPCLEPRCPALAGEGETRCAVHRRDPRPSRTARGYDEDWQRLRFWFMQQPENQLCRHCHDRGLVILATDVDHIIPFRSLDDPRRLDRKNLQPLCSRCHGLKTRRGG
ncbi:MAG: HNH endonuclease [Planctomycetota bacterium]|nr:MAG: HNH endonuclease [Planctomycetota bacterium]